MKKLLTIAALGVTALAIIVYTHMEKTETPSVPVDADAALTYFSDSVTNKVKTKVANYEKLGLGGGVDGFNLLKVYPNLLPSDFENVQAYQGYYFQQDGKLFYSGHAASNSAVLLREGMLALLDTVSKRFGTSPQTKEGIDQLLLKLEEPRVAENPEGEADPSRMNLEMQTWTWIKALYNDGRIIMPKKSDTFALTFKPDGTFSAKTDCNSVGGMYVAKKGAITFSSVMMTEMYCEGSQDGEFARMLENTTSYHFTGRGELILDLKFDSGTVTFR